MTTTDKAVVIYCDPGCDRSGYALSLARHYKKTAIIGGASCLEFSEFPSNALVLTSDDTIPSAIPFITAVNDMMKCATGHIKIKERES
ncbi:hypothetical protein [Solimicrobium silvestre]|uniref:Uncharacterized protein n=1 Tax=Solimicrobium silvestre TaxID=2099400 RepID=A0A2S9GZD5_9BURK|nr:hypothetical protein [Solimicrobium silvestre]PRC93067.1 hypothetical protein S2091_2153 [Solimicrobium silvestre]